jgi:MoaA/NifB/PqqE/SkfB family radical SAM enzyme
MQNNLFRINKRDVAYREIPSLGVGMRRGDFFEVDGVARFLFRELLQRTQVTMSDLTSLVASQYRVPPETAQADVAEFLADLVSRGIVTGDAPSRAERGRAMAPPELACWSVARDRSIPLKCKFNITYRCNIACKFCYNGDRPGLPGPYPMRTELELHELAGILRQLHDAGTFVLTLTGGEPLARRDLPDILDITDELGLAVEILTNGTLVTDDLAENLAKHRIQIVVVPLFGANPATHDAFVRVPGSFGRACLGIRRLLDAGIEVGVRCAINQATFGEWKQLRGLVEDWGARYFPHAQVHLSSDRQVDVRHLRLRDEQIAELFDGGGLEFNPGYRCHVGLARVDIMPNGDVALCSLLTDPLGNLRDRSFSEIWTNSKALSEIRSRHRNGVSGCDGCSHGDEAYRCSADALFDDGNLHVPSSEALRIIEVAQQPHDRPLKRASGGSDRPWLDATSQLTILQ